jgi:hypothetical protein
MAMTSAFAVIGWQFTKSLGVWLNAGYGTADVIVENALTFDFDPSQSFRSRVEYDGGGFLGGLSLGLKRELGGRAIVRSTVGFQMANMGELDSPIGPPRAIPRQPGVLQGEIMQTDFTGLHISVAVGAVLNKVR